MGPWLPYVYVYGVGGCVFLASLVAGVRAGAIDLNRPADRRTLLALVAGLLLFATVHAIWIWAASQEPPVSDQAAVALTAETRA